MLTLLQFNLPLLAIALLVGIVTGRWIVRSRSTGISQDRNEET